MCLISCGLCQAFPILILLGYCFEISLLTKTDELVYLVISASLHVVFSSPHTLNSTEGSRALKWGKTKKELSTENCPLFCNALSGFLHAWGTGPHLPFVCLFFWLFSSKRSSEICMHLRDWSTWSSVVLIWCFVLCFLCLCSFCFQLCAHQKALQCSTPYSTAVTQMDSKCLTRLWLVSCVSWHLSKSGTSGWN